MTHTSVIETTLVPRLIEFAACVVRRLIQAHIWHHCPDHRCWVPAQYGSSNVDFFLKLVERDTNTRLRETLPNSAQSIGKMFLKICNRPTALQGKVLERPAIALSRPLTPYMVYMPYSARVMAMQGLASEITFERMLQVPSFPDHASGGVIAYCSKNEKATQLIRAMLSGKMKSLCQKNMAVMEASIMESLYIR